jgi:UPF0755 protein
MEKLWAQRQKGLPFKSWEEAVVLASIVEKETGRNDERERVAAVFINRLKQNMPLQSDPTILYGIGAGKTEWGRRIFQSEIDQKTSHNTYQMRGLPPTPICNPGRAAIEAVLNPASTKEIFFVADGKGGHIFSETLKDHNVNVQKYRALEREKEKEAKAKMAAPGATPGAAPAQPDKAPSDKAPAPDKAAPDKPAGKTAEKSAPGRTSPDRSKSAAPAQAAKGADNKTADKSPADKDKNATVPPAATRPGASSEDGAWSSTTEPAPPKTKR